MTLISEAASAPGQLAASLAAGVAQISDDQTVSFQQYTKSTLPIDGYVFWVATGTSQQFSGSLHVLTDRHREEDQTIAANKMVFTATEEVSQLNAIAPGTMWVGSWNVDGTTLQVAFSETGANYQQAGLWHYRGFAVYPALSSQLVESAADLPPEPIVSNSLPIWLSQTTFGTTTVPVYPSYLVPDNVVPPYIVAHVEPDMTEAPSFPIAQWPGNPVSPNQLVQMSISQLAKDNVRLTLYGFTNQMAWQYLAMLIDYSVNTDNFGFGNTPVPRDEKRTQVEISALAMKKTIQIVAWYYQAAADAIARRLILSAGFSSITV
ncbi:hypothetical protein [Paraburkholderia acidisoli]|uniref:Uncharacterized protein n=1 Tax=Paraburkholderia acidisoli TaxID=2571748 RepID=A0A7Z2GR47_9BURK|nr:hypothetical protein [Paraburkholderia acidisoli]QGZ66360.1 hypothetical protein FAZ98_31715 [Paraburkholderia acidisoli]